MPPCIARTAGSAAGSGGQYQYSPDIFAGFRSASPHKRCFTNLPYLVNNPFFCIFRAHRGGAKIGAAGRRRAGGNLCEWLCECKSLSVKIYNKFLLLVQIHIKHVLCVVFMLLVISHSVILLWVIPYLY